MNPAAKGANKARATRKKPEPPEGCTPPLGYRSAEWRCEHRALSEMRRRPRVPELHRVLVLVRDQEFREVEIA